MLDTDHQIYVDNSCKGDKITPCNAMFRGKKYIQVSLKGKNSNSIEALIRLRYLYIFT
jgi:hypothetical protein